MNSGEERIADVVPARQRPRRIKTRPGSRLGRCEGNGKGQRNGAESPLLRKRSRVTMRSEEMAMARWNREQIGSNLTPPFREERAGSALRDRAARRPNRVAAYFSEEALLDRYREFATSRNELCRKLRG